MVVIFTNSEELSLQKVFWGLEKRAQKYIRINTDTIHREGLISFSYDNELHARFEQKGNVVDVSEVRSAWFRRPIAPPKTEGEYSSEFISEEFRLALWSFYTTADIFWLNPPIPTRYILESNKLYQQKLANKCGLMTPKTLITNNPVDAINFCKKQGGIVAAKVVHSHLVNAQDEVYGVYTQRISTEQLQKGFAEIKKAPILLQEYIPKKLELRITIVGENVFPCAIDSQSSERTRHDWRRYDFKNVSHFQVTLPKEVENKLKAFMRVAQINFGALDMIITPRNEYVFLEVNPSGQFGWIEELTGMPISDTIASLLTNVQKNEAGAYL